MMPLFAFSQENTEHNIFEAKKTIDVEGLSKSQIYDILKNINMVSKTGKFVDCTPENMSVVLMYSIDWEKDPAGRVVPLCVNANCQIKDGSVRVFLLNYHLRIHSSLSNNSPLMDVNIETKGPSYYKDDKLEKIENIKTYVFNEIEKTINEQKDNYLE